MASRPDSADPFERPARLPERADTQPFSGLGPDGGILHATTVARGNRALLITGPSGSGKSSLALRLLALGATLVADDRTFLAPRDGARPLASAPDTLPAQIEARGLGLIGVPLAPPTPVTAVLDLATPETDRLPPNRVVSLLGAAVPLLHNAESAHFAAALCLYLDAQGLTK